MYNFALYDRWYDKWNDKWYDKCENSGIHQHYPHPF